MKQDVEGDEIFFLHVIEIISIQMPLLLIKCCVYLKAAIQLHSAEEAGFIFVTATNSRPEREKGKTAVRLLITNVVKTKIDTKCIECP